MTQIVGDATHIKGKHLEGTPGDKEVWVYDETEGKYTTERFASENHAASHVGSDEIDGDKLDIDFDPTNYSPNSSIAEADDPDDLAAHLKGIDDQLGVTGGELGTHGGTHSHAGTDPIDGDRASVDYVPEHYVRDAEPAVVDDVKHLSAHLAGIDAGLGLMDTLENNIIMLAWDQYSYDQQFADVATDTFGDQVAVDLENTIAEYDSGNGCYKKIVAASGLSSGCEMDASDDFSMRNVQGSIARWIQDDGAKGHFVGITRTLDAAAATDEGSGKVGLPCTGHGYSSGQTIEVAGSTNYDAVYSVLAESTNDEIFVSATYAAETFAGTETVNQRITLGSGNDNPEIETGLRVVFSGVSQTIVGIGGDGEADSEVTLDATQSGAGVTGVHGVTLHDPAMEVGVNHVTAQVESWSVTMATNNDGYANYTIRSVMPGSQLYESGTKVRVTLNASATEGLKLDHVSIVERDGSTANGKEVPTQILFGGLANCTISAGSSIVSDWTNFTVDQTKDYLLVMDLGGDGNYDAPPAATGDSYIKANTDSWNTQNLTGATPSACFVSTKLEVETEMAPGSLFAVHTTDQSCIDTSLWMHMNSVAFTQTTPGTAKIYYAVSFDGRQAWKVFKSSVWRDIVRNDGGSWQYKDASDVWQNAASNFVLVALEEALQISENQLEKSEIEALGANDWEVSGGLVPGTTTVLDFAIGFVADEYNVPMLDSYTVHFDRGDSDITLTLGSWEASQTDPHDAYTAIKVKPKESIAPDIDLKAWVSMDDGVNYEQISGLSVFKELSDFQFVRGDKIGLNPHGDSTMRLKLTSHNNKDVEIHATALGVKYL